MRHERLFLLLADERKMMVLMRMRVKMRMKGMIGAGRVMKMKSVGSVDACGRPRVGML